MGKEKILLKMLIKVHNISVRRGYAFVSFAAGMVTVRTHCVSQTMNLFSTNQACMSW